MADDGEASITGLDDQFAFAFERRGPRGRGRTVSSFSRARPTHDHEPGGVRERRGHRLVLIEPEQLQRHAAQRQELGEIARPGTVGMAEDEDRLHGAGSTRGAVQALGGSSAR
ncbi:MAG: hypothetical protein M3495_21275 [Pseudomonadota bacterium]|nr:hypothetical protein [Gammaproteobacteria bacterium]MDQ3583966.1 hypothetical protein [Pseudomonadota bacterium]